jgi:hypothetical protein
MRAPRIGPGSKSNGRCHYEGREGEKNRESGCVNAETESRARCPQTKEPQGIQKPPRLGDSCGKVLPQGLQKEPALPGPQTPGPQNHKSVNSWLFSASFSVLLHYGSPGKSAQ